MHIRAMGPVYDMDGLWLLTLVPGLLNQEMPDPGRCSHFSHACGELRVRISCEEALRPNARSYPNNSPDSPGYRDQV